MHLSGVREGLLFPPVTRVEVYAVVEDLESGYGRVQGISGGYASLPFVGTSDPASLLACRRSCHQPSLSCRVSLDSMIVGESQILGQIKDAFEVAPRTRPRVVAEQDRQKAISVAKRVRTGNENCLRPPSPSVTPLSNWPKDFLQPDRKTVFDRGREI